MHWFGVPGLANGLAVMRDEESKSLWDHITGECFDGPLEGRQLDGWPVSITTVGAELERDSEAIALPSDYRTMKSSFMKAVLGRMTGIAKEGTFLAPHFRNSMSSEIDPRLPEGEQGLGVMDDGFNGKFYPSRVLQDGPVVDEWRGRELKVELDPKDRIPFAIDTQTGERPMQLLTRWYGFSFTCPDCDIYSPSS